MEKFAFLIHQGNKTLTLFCKTDYTFFILNM